MNTKAKPAKKNKWKGKKVDLSIEMIYAIKTAVDIGNMICAFLDHPMIEEELSNSDIIKMAQCKQLVEVFTWITNSKPSTGNKEK